MIDYGSLEIKDIDKVQVNKILDTLYQEEAISEDSIWWEDLVDTYNRNICGIYTGYTLSKIIASYYVIGLYIRGSGAVTNGASVSNGHLSLSGINAVEGSSVGLARDYLITIVGTDCDYAVIDVFNADRGNNYGG